MRRLAHMFRLACILLLAAAFSPWTVAASNVPFQATIDFSEGVVPGSELCYLGGNIVGTGVASRLGSFTVTSTDCINPLPPTYTSFGFSSSSVVLATRKGSLFATYMGILSADGAIAGTYLIHGGTDAYANTSGSGILQGFEAFDPATGAGRGQITLKGTVSH